MYRKSCTDASEVLNMSMFVVIFSFKASRWNQSASTNRSLRVSPTASSGDPIGTGKYIVISVIHWEIELCMGGGRMAGMGRRLAYGGHLLLGYI